MSRNALSSRSSLRNAARRNRLLGKRPQENARFRQLRHEQLEDRRLLSVSYPEFSSAEHLALLGEAAIAEGNVLRLARVDRDGTGAAWYREQQFVAVDFETTFQFQLSGREDGSDGFAFVIQGTGTSAIGGGGGGIGYDGIPNSVAVEFDTFLNSQHKDTSHSHVSVHTRGLEPNSKSELYSLASANTSGFLLDDQDVHTAKLAYTPGQLSVYVDDMTDPLFNAPLDIASTLNLDGGRAWVGFTGVSGGAPQNHDILNWHYDLLPGTESLFTVDNVVQVESSAGTTTDYVFTVSRLTSTEGTATVDWATADGSATADDDYLAATGQLVFANGVRQQTFTVTVYGDGVEEGREDFYVNLSNPVNGTIIDGQGVGAVLEYTNDPLFSDQWALSNVGQTGGTWDADIDAPAAWDVTTGSMSTVVAIMDDGVDYTHEDLYLNIYLNQGEIPSAIGAVDVDDDYLITFRDLNDSANASFVTDWNGNGHIDAGDLLVDPAWANGADEDGNGYADDLSGWDFHESHHDPIGTGNHGTAISGTIAAGGDNGVGIAGINWQVQIMPIRIQEGGERDINNAAAGLTYAVDMGATISSNSWGDTIYTDVMYNAIDYARINDHLFVAAAGNLGSDAEEVPVYPASYDLPNIIAVAASDHTDTLASFSNYGLQRVDLSAPSPNVWTTVSGNTYVRGGGTSMATPHVSGVAALLRTAHPEWTAAQIKSQILDTVDPLPSLEGKTVSGGRLNAAAALATTSIHVSDPSIVEGDGGTTEIVFNIVRRGDTSGIVTLNWTTRDGTALAGIDYAAASGQVVFSDPAVNELSISVLVNGDTHAERPESLYMDLVLESGSAVIADTRAKGIIVDDDTTTQTYQSEDTPIPLDDARNATKLGVTTSTIEVVGSGSIFDLNVLLDISHTYDGQLTANLYAPDGTKVELFSGVGGLGNDFAATEFNDQATTSISAGSPPYTGSFRPEGSLASLNDMETTGSWTLEIIDDTKYNIGTLNSWSLEIATYVPEPNQSPVAEANGPYTGTEDVAVTFDAGGSYDPDGSIVEYTWDFGDGTTPITTPSATVDHAYAWGATFDVTLTVKDDRGGTATDSTTAIITEVNDVPVADPGGPYNGVIDIAVNFDGSGSSDFDNGDGTPINDQTLTYSWDFGDTTQGSGVAASHTYTAVGTYMVTLSVSDGEATSPVMQTQVEVTEAQSTMHVSDLEGTATAVNKRKWMANVTVLVQDTGGVSVPNATVQGTWSTGLVSTATTDINGVATVNSGNVDNGVGSVTFTVTNITHGTLTYEPGDNGDLDGDSDGTTITVTQGQALLADGDRGITFADNLSLGVAEAIAAQALTLWSQQPVTVPQVNVTVADLPSGTLGWAYGDTITIDVNANGAGWYTDLNAPAAGRFDLLTVVTHEIGHLLGYEHSSNTHDVMASTLPVGTRRLPGVEPRMMEPALVASLPSLQVNTRTPVVELPTPAKSLDRVADANFDLFLAPLVMDRVQHITSSPEAYEVRTLDDILDEETELVEEGLLDLLLS